MTAPSVPRPAALTAAAVVVAIQGVGVVALGVVGLLDVQSSTLEVGVSVALFFVAYGVALVACARALSKQQAWARGPVLLTQLILLGLAWNFRDNPLVAASLAIAAVVVLVALVQRASVEALT